VIQRHDADARQLLGRDVGWTAAAASTSTASLPATGRRLTRRRLALPDTGRRETGHCRGASQECSSIH
jgi:hypothetical protein